MHAMQVFVIDAMHAKVSQAMNNNLKLSDFYELSHVFLGLYSKLCS